MSGPLSPQEERDMERMDREDAMVANYDPADHARGIDDVPEERECEVCFRPSLTQWCPRCRREQDAIEERR